METIQKSTKLQNITFNKIGACEPGKNIVPSWKEIKSNFYEIDFNSARNTAYDVLHDQGIEITDYLLKQETVWQLLDSGYLDVHFDTNSADIDRGWYSDILDSLSEKYVNGIIRFDEIQNIYNIDDKPDQLTLINNEIYCHPLNGNMNNPQKETPDTWKVYGSDKDTVLEIIGRTLDLADESTLSKNDLIIKSQLNSIYEENNNDLNKALLNSSNSIVESYLKKVKQNLTEKDKKVVEKILIASQKALSGFNVEEKAVIGQFFLNSGASKKNFGNIISEKLKEQEKLKNKNKKQEPSYDIER